MMQTQDLAEADFVLSVHGLVNIVCSVEGDHVLNDSFI
jgi:hypothetical protein